MPSIALRARATCSSRDSEATSGPSLPPRISSMVDANEPSTATLASVRNASTSSVQSCIVLPPRVASRVVSGTLDARQPATPAHGSGLARPELPFRALELGLYVGDVVRLLSERLGVPLAAWGCEEVPSVHVDGAGMHPSRIVDRVDRVVSQEEHVTLVQLLPARRHDRVAVTPVERVVLSTAVDADRGPHPMLVREQRDQRGPHDVEHGQVRRVVKRIEPRTPSADRVCKVPV